MCPGEAPYLLRNEHLDRGLQRSSTYVMTKVVGGRTKSVRKRATTGTDHLATATKTSLMDRPPPQLLSDCSPET